MEPWYFFTLSPHYTRPTLPFRDSPDRAYDQVGDFINPDYIWFAAALYLLTPTQCIKQFAHIANGKHRRRERRRYQKTLQMPSRPVRLVYTGLTMGIKGISCRNRVNNVELTFYTEYMVRVMATATKRSPGISYCNECDGPRDWIVGIIARTMHPRGYAQIHYRPTIAEPFHAGNMHQMSV